MNVGMKIGLSILVFSLIALLLCNEAYQDRFAKDSQRNVAVKSGLGAICGIITGLLFTIWS